jgi:hypothetical protein
MGWLKRNLLFVIGGVLALGLLGAAGVYDYKCWQRNAADFGTLTEIYNNLKNNTVPDSQGHPISPGNDKVNNIAAANEQRRQLEDWIRRAKEYFQPIAPIPNPTNGPISNESFAGALHRTLDQLQNEAAVANVQLPPQYAFSFAAQSAKVVFAPGSIGQLSQELGEVKAISEALYAARVNALESIQRVPVSDDDTTAGLTTDYLTDQPVTNNLAVLMPYQVTFRGFSAEIAQTLDVFATSPHGFLIKTISVMPASMSQMAGNPGDMTQQPYIMSSAAATAPGTFMPAPMPGRGGLQTVLNEQMLRVTMEIEVVKLSPGI